jgi:disulfide bond formation protein DsbB
MQTIIQIANFCAGVSTILFFIGALLLVMSFFVRNEFFSHVKRLTAQYALHIGLVVSFIAVAGSLFYSEVAGYEPCTLCWWVRVAVYPMLVVFAVGLYNKDMKVFLTTLFLSIGGLFFSIQHNIMSWTGVDLGICADGALCNKMYVNEFGFVTIPLMGLGVLVFLFMLSLVMRKTDTHA